MTWCSIIRSSFVLSLSAKLSREEPDAVILSGSVGGEGGNILTYPATTGRGVGMTTVAGWVAHTNRPGLWVPGSPANRLSRLPAPRNDIGEFVTELIRPGPLAARAVSAASGSVWRRGEGIGHKAPIKGKITARRPLPSKILSHCLPHDLPPSHGLPIQSERPFQAANQIVAGRVLEHEPRRRFAIEGVIGCVDHGVPKAARAPHNRQGAISHRIELGEPARLITRGMKQNIASGNEPMREWLLVADAECDPLGVAQGSRVELLLDVPFSVGASCTAAVQPHRNVL